MRKGGSSESEVERKSDGEEQRREGGKRPLQSRERGVYMCV